MVLPSNLLKVKSTSVCKLWSIIGIYQYNALVIDFRRKFSTAKSTSKSKQELGNTNEEAAESNKIFRVTEPDFSLATPAQDLMKNKAVGKEFTAKVTKDDQKKSVIDRDIQQVINNSHSDGDPNTTLSNLIALSKLQEISDGYDTEESVDLKIYDPLVEGHKFGLPDLPIPSDANFKYKDDALVKQVTNLLMRDGKKGVAQRNMSFILNVLRTSPPPKFNPLRPLVPGHPPAHHLPLDPIGYLSLAIDSVAPLLRIRSERGAAGGGAALQIPVPLRKRQRRRQAIMWILNSVNKRTNRGSGRGTFAQRFADEIINVVEGKSSAWDKRLTVHKAGTTARNNVNFRRRR